MKTHLSLLVLLCVLLLPMPGRGDDKLVSVDVSSGLITVDQRGTLKAFRAKQFTEISLNGAKATIDQLRPGMMLTVALSDPQTASKITARGNPAQPAAPAGGKAPGGPGVSPAGIPVIGTARRVTIKMRVDGSDVVKIGGGRLWIEHGGAKKPTGIAVNGVNWEPTWKGNTSEMFTGFSAALAPFVEAKVSVKQAKGRGETTVVEPPTTQNNQTLSFRIQDGGSGADEHEVHVSW